MKLWIIIGVYVCGCITGAILYSDTVAKAAEPPKHDLWVEQAYKSARNFVAPGHVEMHGNLYCTPTGKYVGHCSVTHDDGAITLLLCDENSCMIEGRVR